MHPYINIATSAVREAGQVIARAYDEPTRLEIKTKSHALDLVSNIDQQSESILRYHINKNYKDHMILGEEEGGELDRDCPHLWIIDPLDGTLNFIRGIPQFVISMSLLEYGVITHAITYHPLSGELFLASKGKGATLNGKRLRVQKCSSLNQAVASCKSNVCPQYGALRYSGATALDLAYVAAGRLDFCVQKNAQAWDVAAGALLVREAGGLADDFQATGNFLAKGEIVAANPKLFSQLVQILS